ncbi:MAG TPA: flagellar biosynthesis anti-sigma factor FlgM [Candidatus Hydrogenedentes bacterium]|jgi:anti-sigma28 factor (negative regulator of flagellin synthesis)|nr:flagellar biosynthesis anti-sigma factor FlgM [Candidatus Hydrogenedentota bacterium]
MVGVNGIPGVPEPSTVRKAEAAAPVRQAPAGVPAADGVEISLEAQAAARAVQAERLQAAGEDVRAERVAEAKRNLEQGAHRVQEVVKLVAARMTKQLVL